MKKATRIILIISVCIVLLFLKWWYQDRIVEYVLQNEMQDYLVERYQEDFTFVQGKISGDRGGEPFRDSDSDTYQAYFVSASHPEEQFLVSFYYEGWLDVKDKRDDYWGVQYKDTLQSTLEAANSSVFANYRMVDTNVTSIKTGRKRASLDDCLNDPLAEVYGDLYTTDSPVNVQADMNKLVQAYSQRNLPMDLKIYYVRDMKPLETDDGTLREPKLHEYAHALLYMKKENRTFEVLTDYMQETYGLNVPKSWSGSY